MKIQASDLSYSSGKSNFEDDGTKNYLVFQQVLRYFLKNANSDNMEIKRIVWWKY